MNVKKCRHCDMSFQRDDASPIPHDRCQRCHEEIEALKTPLCADERPCGQQDDPNDDAYCLKCPHEKKPFGVPLCTDGTPCGEPTPTGERFCDVCPSKSAMERLQYDPVTRPAHYQSDEGIECIDAIRAALGLEGFVAHCRGTAIKYAWRAGSKGDAAECLRKGAWYLTRAAEELEQ